MYTSSETSSLLEGQVDCQDVHTWFAQQPQGAALGVLRYHLAYCRLAHPACPRHPTYLIGGSGRADVGIQSLPEAVTRSTGMGAVLLGQPPAGP